MWARCLLYIHDVMCLHGAIAIILAPFRPTGSRPTVFKNDTDQRPPWRTRCFPRCECSEETSNQNPSIEEPAEDLTEEFVEQTVRTPSHKEPPTIDR